MRIILQPTDQERLNNKEGSRRHIQISLGREKKIFGGVQLGKETEGPGGSGDRVKGKRIRRDYWNWGTFKGLCENLVQWKLPETCEGNPREDT